MNIIDLHCDTIMHFYEGKHLADMENTHINLKKLEAGHVLLQCFAIYVPTHDYARVKDGVTVSPEAYFDDALRAYEAELALNRDRIRPVRAMADLEENRRDGVISALLTVEDGVTLNGRIENVDSYHRLGVRMVALTWNYENSIGYPNSRDAEKHRLGLKPFGFDAVRRMNELGIVVDVSHLSEGGFYDVASVSTVPFIASHSCCRALCEHPRNLTDDQLRTLGNTGGIVGLNYCDEFLHRIVPGAGRHTDYEDLLRHLTHIMNVAGEDAMAMGSDYDGIDNTLAWGDAAGNLLVAERLNSVFPARIVDKITHENALRVFRATIG